MGLATYSEIRQKREVFIKKVSNSHFKLNIFHDEIMQAVVKKAIEKTVNTHGPLPSTFSFFVMGSAGRFEQAIWSDQDHGIIYFHPSEEAKIFFLALGKEISDGLFQVGYQYCDGGVMSSNPLWCKSFSEWQEQLSSWIQELSWESIRNLLIFIDGRALYGDTSYVNLLKDIIYNNVHNKHLLLHVFENTMKHKKSIGIFGQLLVESYGEYSGMLNFKEKALFPFINTARVIAIKDRNLSTSTLTRLIHSNLETFSSSFLKLLDFRLLFANHTNYQAGHYLQVNNLSHEQRKEIKSILKKGTFLYHHTQRLVRRGE